MSRSVLAERFADSSACRRCSISPNGGCRSPLGCCRRQRQYRHRRRRDRLRLRSSLQPRLQEDGGRVAFHLAPADPARHLTPQPHARFATTLQLSLRRRCGTFPVGAHRDALRGRGANPGRDVKLCGRQVIQSVAITLKEATGKSEVAYDRLRDFGEIIARHCRDDWRHPIHVPVRNGRNIGRLWNGRV